MAIGVNQYQILSPEQANPIGFGYSQGAAAKQNLANALLAQMKAQEQAAKNPYVGQQSLADLISTRLKNTGQQNINDWYGSDMASQIDYRGAQGSNSRAEAAKTNFILKHPGLLGSDTTKDITLAYLDDHPELANQKVQEMTPAVTPTSYSQKTIEEAGPGSSVNPSPWAQKAAEMALPTPSGSQSQPGKVAQGIANQAGTPYRPRENERDLILQNVRASIAAKQNRGGGVGVQEIQRLSQYVAKEHPEFSEDQIQDATDAYLEGRDTLKDGTKLPSPTGSMKTILEESYKRQTDVGQRAQQRYADTVETAISHADAHMPAVVKYAGVIGSGKGSFEKLSSALGGAQSPDFLAYNKFVHVDVPTIAGEYMRELGVNASDQQKEMYKAVVDPTLWYNDPSSALSTWNYFKESAKGIGKTLNKSAFDRHNDSRKDAPNEKSVEGQAAGNGMVWMTPINGGPKVQIHQEYVEDAKSGKLLGPDGKPLPALEEVS